MFSKKAKDVLRVTMDMLLRLRANGFHFAHIHSDQGHEFSGSFCPAHRVMIHEPMDEQRQP